MCDLLWADPMEDFSPTNTVDFVHNETRGTSYCFGYKAAVDFLNKHKWLSVIRAHEAQDSGYRMYAKNQKTGFPALITLFSAPNYLDAYSNKAAILRYEDNVMNIRQFNHSPHPYWLPNFMDVFSWSLPFVAEKVAEMLLVLLRFSEDDEEREEREHRESREKEKRRQQIRNKILAVTKMMRMYTTLRTEQEAILMLKGLSERNQLPQGILSGGAEAIREAIGNFGKAKEADKDNEMRPASPVPEKQLQQEKIKELQKKGSQKNLLHQPPPSSPHSPSSPHHHHHPITKPTIEVPAEDDSGAAPQ